MEEEVIVEINLKVEEVKINDLLKVKDENKIVRVTSLNNMGGITTNPPIEGKNDILDYELVPDYLVAYSIEKWQNAEWTEMYHKAFTTQDYLIKHLRQILKENDEIYLVRGKITDEDFISLNKIQKQWKKKEI